MSLNESQERVCPPTTRFPLSALQKDSSVWATESSSHSPEVTQQAGVRPHAGGRWTWQPDRLQGASTYPKQGDRAWEEMRGCSHRCPQDAVGLRNLGGSWPANVTQDAGAAELIAFLGEIRSASVGGRLSCSSARKRGVGFTVLECPRELAVSPDLPTDSI